MSADVTECTWAAPALGPGPPRPERRRRRAAGTAGRTPRPGRAVAVV